mgnify:CR=1 FL=1
MSVDIYSQAKQACEELCNVAKLKEGSIVVVAVLQVKLPEELSAKTLILRLPSRFSRVFMKCLAKRKSILPLNAANI